MSNDFAEKINIFYLFIYISVQVQEKSVQNNASGSCKNEKTAFERKSVGRLLQSCLSAC